MPAVSDLHEELPPAAAPDRASRTIWLVAFGLLIAVAAIYANSWRDAFVFDDIPSIPDNPTLRHLWPLTGPLSPPAHGQTVTGRPVLNLSLAVNYVLTGESPGAFRMTNVAIHFLAGLLVFGLARRTLVRLRACGSAAVPVPADAFPVAATIAMVWLLHPLQTAAVTYIVQRAESLMALWYLLTLYAFVRGIESPHRRWWFAAGWLACALGMATKEVMVSAPLIVLLYDRLVLAESWREIWRNRRWFYGALASTWVLLGWLVVQAGLDRGGSTGVAHGITATAYWLTQFPAIAKYAGLVLWPHPLVFDYGAQWVYGGWKIAAAAAAVLALVAATIVGLRRGSILGFLGTWSFAVLAPSSGFPGTRQTMAEHRPYLALVPVIALLVCLLYRWAGRRGLLAGVAVAAALGLLTARRNLDYRSLAILWGDTVRKRPENAWARINYGTALAESGRSADAVTQFQAALRLDPSNAMTHYNLGSALIDSNRTPEAIAELSEAVRLNPAYDAARNNLAGALFAAGRFDEAAEQYRAILAHGGDAPEVHYNCGNALLRAGHTDAAIGELETALRERPDYPEANYNLGLLLLNHGKFAEAAARLDAAVRARPDDSAAHNYLGSALAQIGRLPEAVRHIREAIRLDPRNAAAHATMAVIYDYLGQPEGARRELEEALRLDPNNASLRKALTQVQGN